LFLVENVVAHVKILLCLDLYDKHQI
jgi:hypothetical protein